MSIGLTPEKLLTMTRQFMESRILLTAAELDLFSLLEHQALSAAQIAEQRHCASRSMRMLLDALVALGLLTKMQDRYRTSNGIAPLLCADSPQSILAMILHSSSLWESWSELTAIVKGGGPSLDSLSIKRDAQELASFISAMAVVGGPLADRLIEIIQPGRATSLLDIGCGPGVYTLAFLRACPSLHATLFDLPDVLEITAEYIEKARVANRVTYASGDFHHDDLPSGHDLALLSAIIHSNSSEQNRALYRKVLAALLPGGRLIIRDHLMSADRTSPLSGAIFAINMLVRTEGGGTYTFEEVHDDLLASGFTAIRLIQTGDKMDGLIEAFRP